MRVFQNSTAARRCHSLALFFGLSAILSGCETFQSESLLNSRTSVNEAVEITSRQQTLMNVVRAYNNEAPLIVNVIESDSSPTYSLSGEGQAGATASHYGAVSLTASGGETVTNRLSPLQGQQLNSQLASQIKVETLNALYDSDWPLYDVFEFAVDRLAPDNNNFDRAEDILTCLDAENSISLATAKSGFSKHSELASGMSKGTTIIQTQMQESTGGDTLNVYLAEQGTRSRGGCRTNSRILWNELYQIYSGSQPIQKGSSFADASSKPRFIELRNSPITEFSSMKPNDFMHGYLGPVMRTRTAGGILRFIVTQPKIAFVNASDYASIVSEPWNSDSYHRNCQYADTYILNPVSKVGAQGNDTRLFYHGASEIAGERELSIERFLGSMVRSIGTKQPLCFYDFPEAQPDGDLIERDLKSLTRLMLIVTSPEPVPDAYASWYHLGNYYSIMPNDYVTQRNLMLLSQLLTIQSTATASPSVTTINPSSK